MTARRSIPKLPGTPLLGHVLEFGSRRMELLALAARTHPEIARVRLGVIEPLFVSSPEIVHEMLVEKPDAFRKNPGVALFATPLLGEGLLRLEHGAHRKRRRMVAPAFTARHIAGYAEEMVGQAEAAASRIVQRQQVDIANESMRVTLGIVGKTLFDADVGQDADRIGEALTCAMNSMMDSLTSPIPMPPQIPTPANLRARRAVQALDEVVYRIIAERRAKPAQERRDLLALLLAARDESDRTGLGDREVRDEAMTLFLAGHETVANTLAWSLYLIAAHPQIRTRLEAEADAAFATGKLDAAGLPRLPLTLQVIKEAMRLYPPAYMFGRQAERDLELSGYPIRRNTLVLVNVFGMHRRPDLFPEPERFDPQRFSPEREQRLPRQAFAPFGAGPRICIGNHFALMEAQLILATWLHRLRLSLVDPSRVPELEPLVTLRPRGGIPMHVSERTHARELRSDDDGVRVVQRNDARIS